ncbi:hypothetical protein [Limnoglobus roseus]|uniref:hypothetical protein n=1 Tax=Limnoglobus roseus TaxID=2598579 RepID=UPI0011EAC1CE|nr:hypothetical protein [Limnoglobus roseus]
MFGDKRGRANNARETAEAKASSENDARAKEQAEAKAAQLIAASEKAIDDMKAVRAEVDAARKEAETARQELAKETTRTDVPEDVRTHLVALLAKCSKLQTYTEQPASYRAFMEHYADVKSEAESVELIGWPKALQAEEGLVKLAVESWELGRKMWETKIGLSGRPLEEFQFNINAAPMYGKSLRELSAKVTKATGDVTAADKLDAILKEGKDTILADFGIKWTFLAAGQPFEKAREGLKAKLKR